MVIKSSLVVGALLVMVSKPQLSWAGSPESDGWVARTAPCITTPLVQNRISSARTSMVSAVLAVAGARLVACVMA